MLRHGRTSEQITETRGTALCVSAGPSASTCAVNRQCDETRSTPLLAGERPLESPGTVRQIVGKVEVGAFEVTEMSGFGGAGREAAEDFLGAAAILDIDLVEQRLDLGEMRLRFRRIDEIR